LCLEHSDGVSDGHGHDTTLLHTSSPEPGWSHGVGSARTSVLWPVGTVLFQYRSLRVEPGVTTCELLCLQPYPPYLVHTHQYHRVTELASSPNLAYLRVTCRSASQEHGLVSPVRCALPRPCALVNLTTHFGLLLHLTRQTSDSPAPQPRTACPSAERRRSCCLRARCI
jgi:hypothetical protein